MRHDPPEYYLIAAALTGGPGPAAREWNWERTIAIAAREGVLPGLHGMLNCPPDVADFLDAFYELNSVRNRQLLAELEELALLLNSAGIEPVLLKGAAYLVAGVYDDPAARLLSDIDLLIPREQSRQAYDLIVRAGYEPCTSYQVNHPTTLICHHHPPLTKVDRLPVEIHHSLGMGACPAILNAREVVDASAPIQLGRARVRLPAAHHLMTHLIMHSQVHHGAYCRIWPPLRSMLDLVRLNRRLPPDWEDVCEHFARHRRSALLNVHLLQTARVFDFVPPFPVASGGLRWLYRRTLWRETRLKYVDPIYMTSRILGKRLSLALQLLKYPAGRKYVLTTPFRPRFYRNLVIELTRD